jgi:3-oxoacyl-[acyl-carrier protein] reductase
VTEGLRGQVAIVTGGAGGDAGLGLTATEGLLRAGARVAVWDLDSAAVDKARQELQGLGLDARFQLVDITNPSQVAEALATVENELGSVDTLVNNAALKSGYVSAGVRSINGIVPFWELDIARFRRLWEVNVLGALITCSAVTPGMLARGRGSIINVVTSQPTQVSPRHIAYGPSKAMLETMTQGMAAQLSALGGGVRANALLPGAAVNSRGQFHPDRPPYDCLVPFILRLASDESRDITGQVFTATEFRPPPESERHN